MTLFRVVVNSTYADLQWFRFLVKKWRKLVSFEKYVYLYTRILQYSYIGDREWCFCMGEGVIG